MKTTSEVPARPSSLQGLPPILPDGPIRALVLGSFPSAASLESGQYYGHAQNRFWRVLAHCRVIEDPAAPYAERVASVRRHGLAIWDLYSRVRREGSGDDRIRDAEPNAVGALLADRGPFPILLNGRRALEWRQHFGELQAEVIELPSTSPRPLHWNAPESRSAALDELATSPALSRIRNGIPLVLSLTGSRCGTPSSSSTNVLRIGRARPERSCRR